VLTGTACAFHHRFQGRIKKGPLLRRKRGDNHSSETSFVYQGKLKKEGGSVPSKGRGGGPDPRACGGSGERSVRPFNQWGARNWSGGSGEELKGIYQRAGGVLYGRSLGTAVDALSSLNFP